MSATTCAPADDGLPDPWSREQRLAHLVDRNPDPRIVEVDLEARPGTWEISPGRTVSALTYNGTVPGPTLEARVGDTVIVHFTNRLGEPTTIHWHGVRVPAEMDGAPDVQPPIAPGASFEYRFVVPDAGTFWYHPHVNEPRQIEHGLHGAIVVRGEREPASDREGVLLLDDVTLDAGGQIAEPRGVFEAHTGREGGVRLVNGRAEPTLAIRAGQRQRWRLVNVSNARHFRLALEGHRFLLLGTDVGLLERARDVDELLLAPGDRADVLVTATGTPGTRAVLSTLPFDRGHGAGTTMPEPVMTVAYTQDLALTPGPLSVPAGPRVVPLDTSGATPRVLRLDEVVDVAARTITFRINGAAYPNVPPINARLGQLEVWDVANESELAHPFHLHGFYFQVLSRNDAANGEPTWEDTEVLRGHERIRIAFRPESRAGTWMYHCHILEHVANGMMGHMHLAP